MTSLEENAETGTAHREILISKALTWRYIIALTLVAALTTSAWISLRLVISAQKSTAAVVNISGRQRMLSQRTALLSSLLVNAPGAERPKARRQLQEAVDLMERSHKGLIHGDASMGLPAELSPKVKAMYFDGHEALDRLVTDYIRSVNALLAIRDEDLGPDNPVFRRIITLSPNTLVYALDKMVSQYQAEGEAAVRRLQNAETTVWLFTIVLLLLEASFIFRPFVERMRSVIVELEKTAESLHESRERLSRHQKHLEELVDSRTADIRMKSMELAESEEKFRLISAVANDAIIMIDPAGAIIYWNPAAREMFGYEAEEALGRDMHGLLAPPRYLDDIRKGFLGFLSSGKGAFTGKTIELAALRRAGKEFPIELSISALPLKGQWHALGIIRDISERKEAEQNLLEAKRAAEDATRLKDKFINLVAHDLRSPFTSILGFLRLMEMEDAGLSTTHRECIRRAAETAHETLEMIDNLLDISRLQTGQLILNRQLLKVKGSVDQAFALVTQVAQKKGIELENNLSPDFVLYGDLPLLQAVFNNLVANAVKFCKRGDKITVFSPSEGKAVVRDSGVGISPSLLPNLFRHDVKTTTMGTAGEPGTGLGLPLCADIVNAHGGTLTVESETGKGAVFTISIPPVDPALCFKGKSAL